MSEENIADAVIISAFFNAFIGIIFLTQIPEFGFVIIVASLVFLLSVVLFDGYLDYRDEKREEFKQEILDEVECRDE